MLKKSSIELLEKIISQNTFYSTVLLHHRENKLSEISLTVKKVLYKNKITAKCY